MGLLIFIGFALFLVGMGWLGSKANWKLAVALSVPFFGLLAWIEATTSGDSIFMDPYGRMLLILIFGPLVSGWLVFFGGLSLNRAERRSTQRISGEN